MEKAGRGLGENWLGEIEVLHRGTWRELGKNSELHFPGNRIFQ